MKRSATVQLRKPLERAVRSGHPWLFRDALQSVDAAIGSAIRVLDRNGKFLASGLVEEGPIAVRIFSLRDEPIDRALFDRRLARALALRARGLPPETDAYRLIHGEGDGLPGFTCDRYGSAAVLKLDGSAAPTLLALFLQSLRPQLEGLGVTSLLLRSSERQEKQVDLAWGPAPARELRVQECGMTLLANLYEGQKTGLFLDHRETRARVRQLADGSRVLNLYGYTGGFSIAAGLGGAERVVTVDSAKPALALADRSWAANGLDRSKHESHAADVQEFLEAAAKGGERYQLIIADPPNFAPRHSAIDKAQAAYTALHGAALRLLSEDGIYVAASCSSHIDRVAFEETLRRGAAQARRVLQVLERASAPFDHPRLLGFPEGDYLKIVIARG
jgi:23S rRNA (cytosine1962-C5)-methyltransferase